MGHPDFHLSTGGFIQVLKIWRPRGFIYEQVRDICSPDESAHPDESWGAHLQHETAVLGYTSEWYGLNMNIWEDMDRDRLVQQFVRVLEC
jgi:hypothetical protein